MSNAPQVPPPPRPPPPPGQQTPPEKEQSSSAKANFRRVLEVLAYISAFLYLYDYVTSKGLLSYLGGQQAQAIYNLLLILALFGISAIPFLFGIEFHSWRSNERVRIKQIESNASVEAHKMWLDNTALMSRQYRDSGAIARVKVEAYQDVIIAFQKSASDESLSEEEREFYRRAVRRVMDKSDTAMRGG